MFRINEQVGPYLIEQQIGQGGMATVYKAYHERLDRHVALKVLHTIYQDDETFAARFEREARLIARLEHNNIVQVYDFAEREGSPYLVMRFVEGDTLKHRLKNGPLSLPRITTIVEAVGSALSYAHKHKVLHRDVKPSNIMVDPDGRIFLMDFGLARLIKGGEPTLSQDMLLGTPQYISPEQARGDEDIDHRADLYSFGIVIYHMVTGRVPFNADTPYAIVHDQIYTPVPIPSHINPHVTTEVEAFLLKALSKEAKRRYQGADEMVDSFRVAVEAASQVKHRSIFGGGPPTTKPKKSERVPRRREPAPIPDERPGIVTPIPPDSKEIARPAIPEPVSQPDFDPNATEYLVGDVPAESPSGYGPPKARRRGTPRSMMWAWIGIILLGIVLTTGGLVLNQTIREEYQAVFSTIEAAPAPTDGEGL